VALFIDQQMAGSYGRAETWYMQGPWQEGSAEQGYQLMLTPAQLYRAAIRNLNDYCQQTFAKRSFAELDELQLPEVPAKEFFAMLLQNTVEGFLADPLYGGNRDFIGWKLIGYPGPRYNYSNEIEHYGKPYILPTVGLLGRAGLPVRHG
jgi:gluconate 2-dehydrogenase gamma chain